MRRQLRSKAAVASVAASTILALALGCVPDAPGPFSPVDQAIRSFMQARNVPGGAVSIVKDGKLLYAHGYGIADPTNAAPKETSLFRIASLTKHFTAVGIMQLVEHQKLSLTTPAFSLLSDLTPLPGATEDSRIEAVTIRQLLDHTGGWDRDTSGDPMFNAVAIAQAAGVPSPPSPDTIIRYMRGRPLDFDPGSKSVYSNFGYCVLGRIIERVSGMSYENYMQQFVLRPAGINNMHLGQSLAANRATNEVAYYQASDGNAQNVFDPSGATVPWPYGGFCIESMDAHGGWIASAVDMARFEAAIADECSSPLLSSASILQLYARPAAPVARNADGSLTDTYYAGGTLVRPAGWNGMPNYWHNGSLPGTATYFVRRGDGISWVTMFNQRSEDASLPDDAIDSAVNDALDGIKNFPTTDLFCNYP
jgi:N-acyl-D-amino-acid deacylase